MRMKKRLMAQMEAKKAEFVERAEEGRDVLVRRADDIRERFSENVTTDAVTRFGGLTLVSAGAAWGATALMRGRRTMGSMALPVALIVGGAALLSGRRMWRTRAAHIGEAELRVRDELRGLGPFARARVIKDVARETVPFVRHLAVRN